MYVHTITTFVAAVGLVCVLAIPYWQTTNLFGMDILQVNLQMLDTRDNGKLMAQSKCALMGVERVFAVGSSQVICCISQPMTSVDGSQL